MTENSAVQYFAVKEPSYGRWFAVLLGFGLLCLWLGGARNHVPFLGAASVVVGVIALLLTTRFFNPHRYSLFVDSEAVRVGVDLVGMEPIVVPWDAIVALYVGPNYEATVELDLVVYTKLIPESVIKYNKKRYWFEQYRSQVRPEFSVLGANCGSNTTEIVFDSIRALMPVEIPFVRSDTPLPARQWIPDGCWLK